MTIFTAAWRDVAANVAPHRAMFILAGFWAIVASVAMVWLGGVLPASPFESAASWHAHEMIYGFGSAAFAGYTLTAMRSWSDSNGLRRRDVAALALLWIVARLAAFGGLGSSSGVVATAGAGFLAAIAMVLLRAAWRARRGASLALFAALLTASQAATLLGASSPGSGVLGLCLLLSVVGGRMIAAFTWNAVRHDQRRCPRFKLARLLAVPAAAAVGLSLMLDLLDPGGLWPVEGLLLSAAAFEAARPCLWQTRQVWRSGLLAMLHLAYLWLPVGLALVALSRLENSSISEGDALHALAAGAVSCSIYAVAARAVSRRGSQLRPAPLDVAGFVMVWSAAVLRVFASPEMMWPALFLWCAGWSIFLARQCATLTYPSPRPVFSGPKMK